MLNCVSIKDTFLQCQLDLLSYVVLFCLHHSIHSLFLLAHFFHYICVFNITFLSPTSVTFIYLKFFLFLNFLLFVFTLVPCHHQNSTPVLPILTISHAVFPLDGE